MQMVKSIGMKSRANGRKRALLALLLIVIFGFGRHGAAVMVVPEAVQGKVCSPAVHFAVAYAQLQKELSLGLPSQPDTSLPDAAVSPRLSADNQAKMDILLRHVGPDGLNAAIAPAASQSRDVAAPSALAQKTAAALDRMLDGVSEQSLRQPQAREAVLASLWDGALWKWYGAQADDVAVSAENEAAAGLKPAGRSWFARTPRRMEPVPPPAVARGGRLAWEKNRGAILAQAQMLRERIDDLARRRRSELEPDAFAEAVDREEIFLLDPLLGRAEINSLQSNGKTVWFARVVHAPTELAVYFLDWEAVPGDSPHLRQILARQAFDAGTHRKDGKAGRDVVIVWERGGRIASVEFHERPAFLSRAWWKAYWFATYKMLDRHDLVFGLIMGAVQGLLAIGLSLLKMQALSWTGMSWMPVIFTVVFGAFIGAFISTYKNWTYRGSWLRQYAKLSLISVFFAYPVVIGMQGPAAMSLLSTHIHALSNVALNNVGKAIWAQIPRMGDRHRQFIKPLPGGLRRAGAVNQAFYMINWTLRLADLIKVPGGRVIFIASMPVGILLTYWYAKTHGFPEAEGMHQAPRRWLKKIKSIFGSEPRP